MRPYIFFLIMILSCTTAMGQTCKRKYKAKLEPGSKVIACGEQFTVEKLKNSSDFIFKTYYPPSKQVTSLITFSDENLTVKNGLFQENWDDGTIVNKGNYHENLREGKWILNVNETGEYKNDQKTGEWIISGFAPKFTIIENYEEGKLHGKQTTLDSLGNHIKEKIYDHGMLLSETGEKSDERMPLFPGCDETNMSRTQLIKCSREKLMNYFFTNLRYPKIDRENNVSGKAVIQFVVNEKGELTNLKLLNAVSEEIGKNLISLVQKMPKWIPGMKNGIPVSVVFTLPVQYKVSTMY